MMSERRVGRLAMGIERIHHITLSELRMKRRPAKDDVEAFCFYCTLPRTPRVYNVNVEKS
jgi:hypothetical protein